ncbi:type II toxin-antitoxin system RatA family toxin [Parasphingorhabdus cellanae]|uniref:Type II toxin-antitoxin system RatA family toxin n=1 Tax=Parasphingorhabdus cellanae TaxID=2806553 RepID=A0ABX7T3R0_9SPHN|nr:type II toxin-antitoxin system RatA family toxin [Parasphingorhabdus cellanae]QTD56209.1 type II toxin-antitoxin system RatA family toxin [Parasphingorhabdus cellanae]
MPAHRETRELPYSAAQMYALVADVGRYEEFLPWVVGTRIRSDTQVEMVADMIVGFKGLREQFTSRVVKDATNRTIEVDYLDGPLKQLHNEWMFRERDGGGSYVDFYVEFTFKNRMFEKLAGQMFAKALHKMTSAFEERAGVIYGNNYSDVSGSNSSSATSAA